MSHNSATDETALSVETSRIALCIPVFNDWESVHILLQTLLASCSREENPLELSVILIDDGSTEPPDAAALRSDGFTLKILHLMRNLGHQRAIAIGLAAISETIVFDSVIVMDGDGEDDPAHIPSLLKELKGRNPPPVVFAQRMRRTESIRFRLGYFGFKILHRVLTGKGCDVGNFSAIPAVWVKRLICSSELWIHYAAAVSISRLPIVKVPCDRGYRYAGRSHMKLTSLVVHGLSAISVFGETVGVRLCLGLGIISGLTFISLIAVLYVRLMTTMAIPGWATNAAGLLLILFVNLLLLTMNSVLVILGARNNATFIPSRDWGTFVSGWTTVSERGIPVRRDRTRPV